MTLKLDHVSLSIEKAMRRYESLVEEVMEEIHQQGILIPKQPMLNGEAFIPEIPKGPEGKPSLSHLSNRDISDLNVQFLSYHDYVLAQFKIKRVMSSIFEKRYGQVKAHVRALHGGSVVDKTDATTVDPRVQDADFDLTRIQVEAELVEAVLKACEADMKVISREVAIREQEFGFYRRDSNIRVKRKSQYNSFDFGLEEEADEEFLDKKKKEQSKPRKDPK